MSGDNAEKGVASRSLTRDQRRRYVDTDTNQSPRYEYEKYARLRSPRNHDRERRVKDIIDREKQMIISSRDLHESFVEPLELVDDSDKDIRVRLGRSLKSVEISGKSREISRGDGSGPAEWSVVNGSNGARISAAIEKPADAGLFAPSRSDRGVEGTFDRKDEGRVKRQISLPYEAYYDEVNQRANPDDSSEMMYYNNRYLKNEENHNFQPILNPYENIGGNKLAGIKGLELTKEEADDYNNRMSRNKDPAKQKKKHAKKKHNNNNNNNKNNNKLKKKRKKIRKSKPSKKTRRKRRHHKKQPKIKDRDKKRKKSMKNRHNVKKLKIDQSEDDKLFHEQRKRHHGKGRKNVRI